MKSALLLAASVCLLAACSQPPAPVALKGDHFYGKKQFAKAEKAAPVQAAVVAKPLAALPALAQDAPVQPQSQSFAQQPTIISGTVALSEPADHAAPHPQLEPLALDVIAQPVSPVPALDALSEQPQNFIWPTQGKIVSRFGPKPSGLINDGINIAARQGEPIWAAADGEVAYAGNELKGYGNMMIIKHAGGFMTAYGHASDMLVKKGARVKQGDLIGYVGKSGAVSTAQLHFGVREGKTPVNPEAFLPQRVASAQ